MTSEQENRTLTRVGLKTAMGQFLREFWIPVMRSERLAERDGPPVRVRLLGESFVAFRGGNGSIGFLAEACPHRGASLALARNEDCSLRCIYHGWKIHASGRVLETPSEPGDRAGFRDSIKVASYPTIESGGILWVCLRADGSPPSPFPNFRFTALPPDRVFAVTAVLRCNWLQALEADLDASHVSILHQTEARRSHLRDTTLDAAPRSEFLSQPWGFQLGAVRTLASGEHYVRMKPLVLPWYTIVPESPEGDCLWHAYVPLDDESTLAWYLWYNEKQTVDPERFAANFGLALDDPDFDPDDFRKDATPENGWGQDRDGMRSAESFSGIKGIALQDIAVVESMGPIVDRTRERLGIGDAAIVRLRRILSKSIEARSRGELPSSLGAHIDYASIGPGECVVGPDEDWRASVLPALTSETPRASL